LDVDLSKISEADQKDITNTDGEIIFDYSEAVKNLTRNRSEKTGLLNTKYGNLFKSTGTTSITKKSAEEIQADK
jgi:hypothetical protein